MKLGSSFACACAFDPLHEPSPPSFVYPVLICAHRAQNKITHSCTQRAAHTQDLCFKLFFTIRSGRNFRPRKARCGAERRRGRCWRTRQQSLTARIVERCAPLRSRIKFAAQPQSITGGYVREESTNTITPVMICRVWDAYCVTETCVGGVGGGGGGKRSCVCLSVCVSVGAVRSQT